MPKPKAKKATKATKTKPRTKPRYCIPEDRSKWISEDPNVFWDHLVGRFMTAQVAKSKNAARAAIEEAVEMLDDLCDHLAHGGPAPTFTKGSKS